MAAAAVCLVAAAAIASIHFREIPPSRDVVRFAIPMPKENGAEGLYFSSHVSPNARSVAVSGVRENASGVFVRDLDATDAGLPEAAWSPRRSPHARGSATLRPAALHPAERPANEAGSSMSTIADDNRGGFGGA
jgi:hypothetical protein